MMKGQDVRHLTISPHNAELINLPGIFDEDTWMLDQRLLASVTIRGRLIGFGSSKREEHNHAPQGWQGGLTNRCAACRWSEIYLFEVMDGDGPVTAKYIVYTLGPSIVENEKTFANLRWATSAHEVVELATVRRGDRGAPYLPAAHARALAMAAEVDSRLEDAYVNRAVA